MTRLSEIQENLQDTNATIAQIEGAIAQDPSSPALHAMVGSLEKRRQSLEATFLAEADSLGIDVCSYRILGELSQQTIPALTSALSSFQNVVTVVYDAIKRRVPKERANVSAESRIESTFNFGYSFPGSLGFILTIPNERSSFGESSLDETIHVIFQIARAQESSQILEFAEILGPASIRAVYKWAFAHTQFGLGADIEWRREREIRDKLLAQRIEFEQLHRVIGETSEERTEELVVIGQLLGADMISRIFHIRIDDGEDIRGKFTDASSSPQTVELAKRYRATINKTVKVRISTGEEDVSYRFTRLEPL